MNTHYLYACIDIGCLVVPIIASFHPLVKFYNQWRFFLPVVLLVAASFILWDMLFTAKAIWGFNPIYITGTYFFNLPIEELAFFICIPYACMFTQYCFKLFYTRQTDTKRYLQFTWGLVLVLIVLALFHLPQLYTSVTFLLVSGLLLVTAVKKPGLLPLFYISFVVNLLPFFISNGLLTGTWVAEPVVWYNNNYNLGLRVGTIPIEDFFYGMLLQLANTVGYNYLARRYKIK